MAFTFFCPVKLIFGQPVAEALPAALAEIGARRVLLLSDPGLAQIGLAEQIAALLRDARAARRNLLRREDQPDRGGRRRRADRGSVR